MMFIVVSVGTWEGIRMLPSVNKQPSKEQEMHTHLHHGAKSPKSSIKGKQGKEWLPRQRLRQAKVRKGEWTSGSIFQTAGTVGVCHYT